MRRTAIAATVLLVLYAAGGFLLAPWLAQRYLPGALAQRLGAAVSVGEFRFNPFLFTVQARDIAVSGGPAGAIVHIANVELDTSPVGLLRQPRTLDRLAVRGLETRLDLRRDGASDVLDLARAWSRHAGPSQGAPAAITIREVSVEQAAIHLIAVQDGKAARATIGPMTLRASHLSTGSQEANGSFQLTTGLPGAGELETSGSVRLQPYFHVQGRLDARRVHAGALMPFVGGRLPLSQVKAQASASANYAWDGDRLSLDSIDLEATQVAARAGRPSAAFEAKRVTATGGVVQIARRFVHFDQVRLAQGRADIHLPATVANPGTVHQASAAGTAPAGETAPWTVQAGRLALEGMDIAVQGPSQGSAVAALAIEGLHGHAALRAVLGHGLPRLVASNVQAHWGRTSVRLPDSTLQELSIGSAAIENGAFDLAKRQVRAASTRLEDGRVILVEQPPGAQRQAGAEPGATAQPWHLALDKLELSGISARYSRRPGGDGSTLVQLHAADATLRLQAKLGGPRVNVQATGVAATVRGATLAGARGQQPALHVASARVAGGRFDSVSRQVHADDVELAGSARLVRSASGLALAAPALRRPREATPSHPAAVPSWGYSVGTLRVRSLDLHLRDRTTQPALALDGVLQGTAKRVASSGQASFDARLRLAQGGTLTGTGTVDLGQGRADAQLQARELALTPLQPLLQRFAALSVPSGTLSASLHVQTGRGAGALQARGRIGISDLLLQEAGTGDHFLSCKRLDVDDTLLDLRARRLTTGRVVVQQPRLKVVVSKDRQVNLLQVLKDDASAGPHAATGAARASGLQVMVGQLQLRGGEVDFADHSLVLPFSTTVRNVEGSIVDLSNLPSRRASVQAEGDIAPYGSAQVEGSFLPAAPRQFTHLDLQFENVRVPPLSPYTATFAGRKVESGKLWLDLGYHVDDGELRGKNDIRLSDFRLGERVKAPDALDVPLDLVVGLMKDDSGTIHLSVPVTGEVGDPHFSLSSAIWQAVGNVLRRAVTAPFRLLANVFGHDQPSLDAVEFPAGSAQLPAQEAEKLQALAQALQARPGLRLAVGGRYDPASDADALREQKARRSLARALGRGPGPDGNPGPFAFDDPQTQQALERLLRSAAGEDAVRDLEQRFTGHGGPQREWELYEAMLSRLAAAQPLADSAARVLAVERARTIADFLRRHGVDGARVQTGTLASARANDEGEVASRLSIVAAVP